MPTTRRNQRVRCDWSLSPQCRAISLKVWGVLNIMPWAISIRRRITHACTVMPNVRLNARLK